MLFVASRAMAIDISINGVKLIIVDKIVVSNTAKAVFVSKDPNITKGTGTNVAAISSQLDISYDAESGTFVNPVGGFWLVNKDTVAKYVNKDAPSGGGTKVSVIKPGKLLRNVGKSLGDSPIDISSAPSGVPISGDVTVVYTINNDGTFRHCAGFAGGASCSHKSIAGGTGWKLSCKVPIDNFPCPASPSGAFVD